MTCVPGSSREQQREVFLRAAKAGSATNSALGLCMGKIGIDYLARSGSQKGKIQLQMRDRTLEICQEEAKPWIQFSGAVSNNKMLIEGKVRNW